MSFNQILIALDRTPRADDVFAAGLNVAQVHNAQLTIMHCIAAVAGSGMGAPGLTYPWPSTMAPTNGEPAANFVEQEEKIVRNWLQRFQQRAVAANIRQVRTDLRIGEVGDRICKAAKDLETDLIVLGRRDLADIEEFRLGSVSNYVARNAPCVVLLVPR